ncbi:MAG: beta-galactosidase trimerization domain-containing protein, partial [Pseudothermotoga sp.]
MSCGYEISGFGLANYDGSVNERALAAGKVARIITENMDIFINSKPTPAQVAILYNIQAHKALACLRAESAEVIRKDIFGIYKSLMNLGLNVDFLHLTDFGGDLSRYKVIFLPFSIALNEKTAEAIDDYISHGGTVVADGRLAWMKEDGTLCEKIPGLGLDKIFGCEELWMKEVKMQTTLEFNGLKLSACRYISVYKTLGAKPVAMYENNPVIVENNHNSGKAIMIGTLIGAGYEETGNMNNLDLIKKIILESDVKQQYYLEDVEIRSSSSSENGLVYLFNHGNTKSVFDASISHDIFGKSFKEAICLNLSKTLMFEDDGKSAILKNVSLNPGQTMVVLLK